VERHSDTEVLEACAKTFETLCADNLAIYTRCNVARSTLIDMLVNKFKEALDEYNSVIKGVINFFFVSLKLVRSCISTMPNHGSFQHLTTD